MDRFTAPLFAGVDLLGVPPPPPWWFNWAFEIFFFVILPVVIGGFLVFSLIWFLVLLLIALVAKIRILRRGFVLGVLALALGALTLLLWLMRI